ncbi:hypothetical protein DSL72_003787 [Monilinia vaccinii-corymbosi]|uniref:BTB domain-containing protein n=1 Tax=Monilinia vaccinii-corymbosi TaxID=61207 RepID=A0A8A3NUA3_9HELO|nr:hypothetical protein DSL72_003787 [Monilinia vaccinii-corymbosi]
MTSQVANTKSCDQAYARSESGNGYENVSRPAIFKFSCAGKEPDTRIVVFDREFHVDEIVLKMYSTWFRKSIEGNGRGNSTEFQLWKNDYVSVIAEDGDDWTLEPKSRSVSASDPERFEKKLDRFNHFCDPRRRRCNDENHFMDGSKRASLDSEAFYKLLCAMYHVRTSIASVEELVTVTSIADYYCALPIVSASIDASLLNDDGLFYRHRAYMFAEFEMDEALNAAVRLRHPVLFRELVVMAVSEWNVDIDPDRFKGLGNNIRLAIVTAAQRISAMSNKARSELYRASCNPFSDLTEEAADDIRQRLQGYLLAQLEKNPYRSCYVHYSEQMEYLQAIKSDDPENDSGDDSEFYGRALDSLINILGELLKVNLRLSPIPEPKEREGLLCAEVPDDELPWDATETYW